MKHKYLYIISLFGFVMSCFCMQKSNCYKYLWRRNPCVRSNDWKTGWIFPSIVSVRKSSFKSEHNENKPKGTLLSHDGFKIGRAK